MSELSMNDPEVYNDVNEGGAFEGESGADRSFSTAGEEEAVSTEKSPIVKAVFNAPEEDEEEDVADDSSEAEDRNYFVEAVDLPEERGLEEAELFDIQISDGNCLFMLVFCTLT